MIRSRWGAVLGAVGVVLALASCEDGAHHACEVVVRQHVPRVREIIDEDIQRATTGIAAAADLTAPGFVANMDDPAQRERDLRWAIQHRIREPPRGIPELMISPMSFVAAVDVDGHVICRDIEPDPMRGLDVGALFPHVRRALTEGVASHELVVFQPPGPPTTPEGEAAEPPAPADPDAPDTGPPQPSVTVVYVAPARVDGRIVGAIIGGTPLWSTARRITRQIQAEGETTAGAIFWVYLFRGDDLYHRGTPSTLDQIVPTGDVRRAGFERSPGGFCGEQNQFGRWYCYGVIHLPQLGDDVGAVIYRSDPVD
jgi:hypothetical protein